MVLLLETLAHHQEKCYAALGRFASLLYHVYSQGFFSLTKQFLSYMLFTKKGGVSPSDGDAEEGDGQSHFAAAPAGVVADFLQGFGLRLDVGLFLVVTRQVVPKFFDGSGQFHVVGVADPGQLHQGRLVLVLFDGFGLIERPLVGCLGLAHLGAPAVFAGELRGDGGNDRDDDHGQGNVFGPRFAPLLFLRGRPVGLEVADELFELADFFIQVIHVCSFGNFLSRRHGASGSKPKNGRMI